MKTMTLLEIVQDILDSMGSDSVSSISDTEESELVAGYCKEVYYDLLDDENWPFLKKVTQLTASGSSSYPTHMQLDDTISEIVEVRYKTTDSGASDEEMSKMTYLHPEDFLDLIYQRHTSDSNIDELTEKTSGIPLFIQNDKDPEYYTSFDDEWLVFDSYDSAVDTTMTAAKSMVRGIVAPSWTESDAAVPEMPGKMFPLYLQRCINVSNERLKQTSLRTSERSEKRKFNRLRRLTRVSKEVRVKNYGRQSP